MQGTESTMQTRDGLTLHTVNWLPGGDARAVVVLVHGIGEHIGRYNHVGAALAEAGYAVYGLDHRSHGRSEGRPRVHFDRFTAVVQDIADYMAQASKAHPELPLFLFGHSMGSLLALMTTLDYQDRLAGLISEGTPLDVAQTVPAPLLPVGRAFYRMWPLKYLHVGPLDKDGLTHDPAFAHAYLDDPLVYQKPARLSMGLGIIEHSREVRARLHELVLPLLILHGGDDRITPPSGSQAIYTQAGAKDKTLKVYEGCYHEVHNELVRDELFRDIIAWLGAHSMKAE